MPSSLMLVAVLLAVGGSGCGPEGIHGLSIPISVLGRDAQGSVIPFTQSELTPYPVREACFFGNLFTQEGLFFGVDRRVADETEHSRRK